MKFSKNSLKNEIFAEKPVSSFFSFSCEMFMRQNCETPTILNLEKCQKVGHGIEAGIGSMVLQWGKCHAWLFFPPYRFLSHQKLGGV